MCCDTGAGNRNPRKDGQLWYLVFSGSWTVPIPPTPRRSRMEMVKQGQLPRIQWLLEHELLHGPERLEMKSNKEEIFFHEACCGKVGCYPSTDFPGTLSF